VEETSIPTLDKVRSMGLGHSFLLLRWMRVRQFGGRVEIAVLRNEVRAVETEMKFAGSWRQQKEVQFAKLKAAEAVAIPEWLELQRHQRTVARDCGRRWNGCGRFTIGQANRIPG